MIQFPAFLTPAKRPATSEPAAPNGTGDESFAVVLAVSSQIIQDPARTTKPAPVETPGAGDTGPTFVAVVPSPAQETQGALASLLGAGRTARTLPVRHAADHIANSLAQAVGRLAKPLGPPAAGDPALPALKFPLRPLGAPIELKDGSEVRPLARPHGAKLHAAISTEPDALPVAEAPEPTVFDGADAPDPRIKVLDVVARMPVVPVNEAAPARVPHGATELPAEAGEALRRIAATAGLGASTPKHEQESSGELPDQAPRAAQIVQAFAAAEAPRSADAFGARIERAMSSNVSTRVADAAEAAPLARPADHVTLQFEGEHGIEGRLRVALRGGTVHATLIPANTETMHRLERDLGELQRALVERGFHDARVAVHAPRAEVDVRADLKQEGRQRDADREDAERSQRDRDANNTRSQRQSPDGGKGRTT